MNPGDIPVDQRPEVVAYNRTWQILTNEQRIALDWWARGLGYKRLGIVLGISSSSARHRIERAIDTIDRHQLTVRDVA